MRPRSAWVAQLLAAGAAAFATLGLVLLGLSWWVPVPPGWGFRGFPAIFAFVFASVGLVVATRRPHNSIGWWFLVAALLSGVQVAAEEYAFYALLARPGELPGGEFAAWLQAWIWLPTASVIAVPVVLVFPNGRLRSRRWMVVAVGALAAVALDVGVFAFAPGPLSGLAAIVPNPFGVPALAQWEGILTSVGFLGLIAVILAAFASVFLRFREAAGGERQQLKWFAYASGVVVVALFLNTVVQAVGTLVLSREAVALLQAHPLLKLAQIFLIAALAFVPVAVAIAIVRYRLYDVDALINRTLVYGATSATIAMTFFAGIVALQPLLRPLTLGSELPVAASTLFSFALFQPVRGRIQDAVDRRFDRSRYDAARTLDTFADRLRDEVHLDALRADLVSAVFSTMRPAHVSLWLRERAR